MNTRPLLDKSVATAQAAAGARVFTPKTTTKKGWTARFVVRPPARRAGQTVGSGTV